MRQGCERLVKTPVSQFADDYLRSSSSKITVDYLKGNKIIMHLYADCYYYYYK